jgi:hypothetical protein
LGAASSGRRALGFRGLELATGNLGELDRGEAKGQ